jgi:hypothetical protein
MHGSLCFCSVFALQRNNQPTQQPTYHLTVAFHLMCWPTSSIHHPSLRAHLAEWTQVKRAAAKQIASTKTAAAATLAEAKQQSVEAAKVA